MQLTEIYGARFVNQYGEKDYSGVWQQALIDINEEGIRFGLSAMLKDIRFETWPPNCTQFRHLCLSQLNPDELPNVHKAFTEVRENIDSANPNWSKTHRAIRFTVAHLGIDVVGDARCDRAWIAFSQMYERVCRGIMQGKQVPEVKDEVLLIKKTNSKKPPRLALIIR